MRIEQVEEISLAIDAMRAIPEPESVTPWAVDQPSQLSRKHRNISKSGPATD